MAGLRQGDCVRLLEEAQPRVHGEEQNQSGTFHDLQELAACCVHYQETVQTVTIIYSVKIYSLNRHDLDFLSVRIENMKYAYEGFTFNAHKENFYWDLYSIARHMTEYVML